MPNRPFRFPKSHRLHLKKEIDQLFLSGKQMRQFPVNVIYRFGQTQKVPVQMAVSVPKKIIKSAVHRNRIKRQIREVYRLNSVSMRNYFESKQTALQLMFIYTGKVSPDYAVLETKIILILQRLVKEHEMAAV
jgi:ribonuclease P protein component